MITIQRETVDSMVKDAMELFKQDWEETVTYSNEHRFDINIEEYKKLEGLNRLFVVSARDDGKMVGYWAWVISVSRHTKKAVATSAGLFIDKEHRGMMIWKTLLDASKSALKNGGIDHIRQSTSPKHDISRLLERMGFQKEETVYGMLI